MACVESVTLAISWRSRVTAYWPECISYNEFSISAITILLLLNASTTAQDFFSLHNYILLHFYCANYHFLWFNILINNTTWRVLSKIRVQKQIDIYIYIRKFSLILYHMSNYCTTEILKFWIYDGSHKKCAHISKKISQVSLNLLRIF